MKILVTGSSGSIGTRLCETLLQRGYGVVGVDRVPNKYSEPVNNVTLSLDLRDRNKVHKVLPGDVDMVIHLAANASVYNLYLEPMLAADNVATTFNVLEYVRRRGVRRVAFASSREVYGNSNGPRYAEGDERIDSCENVYSASKVAGEALLHAYQRCYGLEFVIYRFSNVYGMYDESDRFVPIMIRKMAKAEPITIFGRQKMLDFVYSDDAIEGIMASIEGFDQLKGSVYNIGAGEGSLLIDVAQLIKQELASSSPITIGDSRPGEMLQFIADTRRAEQKMGYRPATQVKDGIPRAVAWYRNYWKL
ncbi:MAG: NAD-dependent epimerase/dehydratase family protein [Candidatus Xenobia bacterium]